jgi:hypothetical protein
VDIDPVQRASRSKVAQLLEGRARKRGTTITIIHEALSRREN